MLKLRFCHLIFVLCTLSFVISFSNCSAQPISSAELIQNAKVYDGRTIVYTGEVIGDIMARGDFAWVNINDGKNAIGVWMNKGLAANIIYTGSYRFKGDLIEIIGVFHRACPDHGGDLDIHAQGVRKINSGRQTIERFNLNKRNMSLVLLGILCLVLVLRQLK